MAAAQVGAEIPGPETAPQWVRPRLLDAVLPVEQRLLACTPINGQGNEDTAATAVHGEALLQMDFPRSTRDGQQELVSAAGIVVDTVLGGEACDKLAGGVVPAADAAVVGDSPRRAHLQVAADGHTSPGHAEGVVVAVAVVNLAGRAVLCVDGEVGGGSTSLERITRREV